MNQNLSDYNTQNYVANIISGDIYRDVSSKFIHLITKNVIVSSDIDAIKNSIKNIILTPLGTRPFKPDFGSNVSKLLFEPADDFTAYAIKNEIITSLDKWEKRIRDVQVNVKHNDDHDFSVRITFQATYDITGEIEFTLNRIR